MEWRHRFYDWKYALRNWRPQWRKPRWSTVALAVLLSGFSVVLIGFLVLYAAQPVPHLAGLRSGLNDDLGYATIVYTADGEELTRYYRENRTWVEYPAIGETVADALVATEDRRFYRHFGVDVRRFFGALWKTFRGDPQGGSTIPMQFARNFYRDFRDAPLLWRKVREVVAAVKFEQHFEKEELIELYLNTVPFGYDAYGIEAAATTYFGKPSKDLDAAEAATLVGMLKATTQYNPRLNPEASRRRRNVVLGLMAQQGYLPQAEYAAFRETPIQLDFHRSSVTASPAPYFAEYVRTWLDDWAERNNYDPYNDGLRVYTTLDTRMQALAQAAVDSQLTALQAVVDYEWSTASPGFLGSLTPPYQRRSEAGRTDAFAYFWNSRREIVNEHIRGTPRYKALVLSGLAPDAALDNLRNDAAFSDSLRARLTRLETGFLALDPHNGAVKAWVGGRDYLKDQYDHVVLARRQPGSTFKPFVYAAALENGRSPYDQVRDVVRTYQVKGVRQTWTPNNVGGASGDTLTLRQGLMHSKNTVTAQLMAEMGPEWVAYVARRMGIQSKLDEVPALALGTSDVNLLELVAAYTPFVEQGTYRKPLVVTHIDDRNGRRLATFTPEERDALPRFTAAEVLDMMRAVVDEGTGVRIRHQFGLSGDLAGKTGTTQNNADGWFVLLHPDLVMGAWVGFNDRRITFRTNYWGQGAHNALFVVGDFMQRAYAQDLVSPNKAFETPGSNRPRPILTRHPPDTTTADSLLIRPRDYDDDVESTLRALLNGDFDDDTSGTATDRSIDLTLDDDTARGTVRPTDRLHTRDSARTTRRTEPVERDIEPVEPIDPETEPAARTPETLEPLPRQRNQNGEDDAEQMLRRMIADPDSTQ